MPFQPGQWFVCIFNSHRSVISHLSDIFNLINDEVAESHNKTGAVSRNVSIAFIKLEASFSFCILMASQTQGKPPFHLLVLKPQCCGSMHFVHSANVRCASLGAVHTDGVMVSGRSNLNIQAANVPLTGEAKSTMLQCGSRRRPVSQSTLKNLHVVYWTLLLRGTS